MRFIFLNGNYAAVLTAGKTDRSNRNLWDDLDLNCLCLNTAGQCWTSSLIWKAFLRKMQWTLTSGWLNKWPEKVGEKSNKISGLRIW